MSIALAPAGAAVAPHARTAAGRQRIAVVGTGAAGLAAAFVLQRTHDVTLFEQDGRAGGHVHTVTLERGPDAGTPIDTGFIVMNETNYPTLVRLFERLGVRTQPSCMSFAYHCRASGFHYAGTGLDGLFSHRANLLSPGFHGMIAEWLRFNRRARTDLARGMDGTPSLGVYLDGLHLSRAFVERYVLPMGAAIWSAPAEAMRAFPAEAFLRFFDNHGLLSVRQPRWKTVVGGSQAWVHAMLRRFAGDVRLGTPVRGIVRRPGGVVLRHDAGLEAFDQAVVATHADQALRLLDDPTEDERRLLGAWSYSVNHALLHTDTRMLPPRRRAWASWNYTAPDAGGRRAPVHVTYYMNRLQRLRTRGDYCVTLNGNGAVRDEHVVREMTWTHPVYDRAALEAQRGLGRLNGVRHTWFCGSYFGYGFHEDAVRSGVHVARAFGLEP